MSKAIQGDPRLDKNVVARFAGIYDSISSAVSEALDGDEDLRNLSQATFDSIEMSLRKTRIECDRGLLNFARYRTIRVQQGILSRLAKIEKQGQSVPVGLVATEPVSEQPEQLDAQDVAPVEPEPQGETVAEVPLPESFPESESQTSFADEAEMTVAPPDEAADMPPAEVAEQGS
jgi:hypothetical protein